MNTSVVSAAQARARRVEFTGESMVVHLVDGRSLSVPLEWFPRLQEASPERHANWTLIGAGTGLHWPDLDEDLSVPALLGLPC
jgi:hypothetical protein